MTFAGLDNPVWESLRGAHAGLALCSERAARYPFDVSPLAGLVEPSASALDDLASLVEPGDFAAVLGPVAPVGRSVWKALDQIELIQMVCETPIARPDTQATPLSADDVPEMLELTEATQPGPFGPRTIEMGRYVGFRRRDQLVAMGGERLSPEGYTEVSAICTAPGFRGRGLAEAIARGLVSDIQGRGEVAFLHVWAGSPSEASAVSLYARLGFRERVRQPLVVLQRE